MTQKTTAAELIRTVLTLQKGIREQAANDLRDLFLTNLSDRQRDVVKDAIVAIRTSESLTAKDLQNHIIRIEQAMGVPIPQKLTENITIYAEAIHSGGKAEGFGQVEFAFNPWDSQAIEWNGAQMVYWVGESYTRGLADELRELLLPAFTEGASREELGRILKDAMESRFGRSKYYYEGLANHIVTRSFNFGVLSGMQDAGYDQYQITAVMDDRTTPICIEMNGKIFSVKRGMELAQALIDSEDPDDVKTVAPWKQPKDLPDVGKNGDELDVGMALPPYHFNCRTTLVALTG